MSDAPANIAPATDAAIPAYTVFYDANCRLCAASRRRLERLRPRARLTFVDLRDDAAMRDFPMVDRAAGLRQMFVLDPAGKLTGGYDAFLSLVPTIPLVRPFGPLLRLPPVRMIGRAAYRWVARNRYRLGGAVSCEGGACRI